MTYGEFLNTVTLSAREHPDWRRGQIAFNTLNQFRPDLAAGIRTTGLDPFYRDEVLPEFWVWVAENW